MNSFAQMFKPFAAAWLLMAFVVQTFSGAFVLVDYFTNTKAYAKNCVNKARPAMHCNGKCQMMKKWRAEQEQEQKNNERTAENKKEVLSDKSDFSSIIAPDFVITFLPKMAARSKGKAQDRAFAIFHPPQA